jgi:hypothetical protein
LFDMAARNTEIGWQTKSMSRWLYLKLTKYHLMHC